MDQKPKLHTEVKKQTVGYIMAALGLVVGLAWNEAIKGLIETILPINSGALVLKFVYAIIMTLVIVLISIKLIKNDNKSNGQ